MIREVRHALDQFARSGNRSFLADAVGLQPEVERAAKEVTDLSSTDFEFGAVAKMNAGLDRFFQKLHELASGTAVGQPQAVHELAEQMHFPPTKCSPTRKKYLDFNEQKELKDRSHDNESDGRPTESCSPWQLLWAFAGAVAGLIATASVWRGIQRTIYQLTIPLHGRNWQSAPIKLFGPVSISNDPASGRLACRYSESQISMSEVNSVIEKFHATNRQILRLRSAYAAAPGSLRPDLAPRIA